MIKISTMSKRQIWTETEHRLKQDDQIGKIEIEIEDEEIKKENTNQENDANKPNMKRLILISLRIKKIDRKINGYERKCRKRFSQ